MTISQYSNANRPGLYLRKARSALYSGTKVPGIVFSNSGKEIEVPVGYRATGALIRQDVELIEDLPLALPFEV